MAPLAAWKASVNFNPRSPRGGATPPRVGHLTAVDISIHAPHEGERRISFVMPVSSVIFQSTLPTRGSDDFAVIARAED